MDPAVLTQQYNYVISYTKTAVTLAQRYNGSALFSSMSNPEEHIVTVYPESKSTFYINRVAANSSSRTGHFVISIGY